MTKLFDKFLCFVFGHTWVARLDLDPRVNVMVAYHRCSRCGASTTRSL
jgi:transcription elongation factor Elf1